VLNGSSPAANGGTGAGTWQNPDLNLSVDSFVARVFASNAGTYTALYSAQFTNVKFQTTVYPVTQGITQVNCVIYARANGGSGAIGTTYYKLTCFPDFAYELKRVVAGVETDLGIATAGTPAGTLVGLQFNGATISVLLNGVGTGSVVDPSPISSAGRFGFAITNFPDGEDTGYSYVGPVTITASGDVPFIPTVVLTENWAGTGFVDGKVPTTGGGAWFAFNNMDYSSGYASPNGQSGIPSAFPTTTYTNARFTGGVYSGTTGPSQNQPAFIYARGNTNDGFPSTCYYITCNSIPATIVLTKKVAGADTTLGTVSAFSNSGVPIGLEVSGSSIKVYRNGIVIISVTDASITAAGYWGFGVTYGEVGEDTGNSSMGAISIQTA
jgi:hypothetical protein